METGQGADTVAIADLRVALVHDWLVTMGGAERVLEELAQMFPQAPIYTGIADPARLSPTLTAHRIVPSFVQGWPRARRWYNRYLPLLAYAVEQWDFRGFDLVISSSASVAKGVLTPTHTRHLAYIHTPMRYAWDLYWQYRDHEARGVSRLLMPPVFHYLRLWDVASAARPDTLVANSRAVAARIEKHWRRPAVVVPPPVDVDGFDWRRPRGDYLLVLSRLVAYKRVDLAVAAANRLRLPLVVAGEGPEAERLQRLAGRSVRFLGRVDGATKRRLLEEARALVFPGEEDFGIVPVEALAAGCPVVAFGRGGVLDSVEADVTGVLFARQEPDAVAAAVQAALARGWDRDRLHAASLRFAPGQFRRRMAALVAELVKGSGRDVSLPASLL